MFHDIRDAILARMRYLEEIDTGDRKDSTPRLERLRQIPPETGKFIALMAASTPSGSMIEIGTSAGYSSLWLSLACEKLGRRLTTFELMPEKLKLARETFQTAGVEEVIDLVEGDARQHLHSYRQVAFCFLDSEKELYEDCYRLVVDRLVPGGILLADNAISHGEFLAPMLDRALADKRVDSLIVPIGKGVLLCRRN
jgi:predicted O-methyltransferase YrrM